MGLKLVLTIANLLVIFAQTDVSIPVTVFYTSGTANKDYILSNLADSVNTKTTNLNSGISFSLEYIQLVDVATTEILMLSHSNQYIIDFTDDEDISYIISKYALINSQLHWILSRTDLATFPWTLRGYISYDDYSSAIWKLMQHYSWDKSIVAVQSDKLGWALDSDLRSTIGYTNQAFVYLADYYDSLLNQVGRIVKSTGSRITVMGGSGYAAKNYLKAAAQKRITKEGYGYILVGEAVFYRGLITSSDTEEILKTGPLILVDEGTENATNIAMFEVDVATEILGRLATQMVQQGLVHSGAGKISPSVIKDAMIENYYQSNSHPYPIFSILNPNNGVFAKVGTVGAREVIITGNVVFPGGSPQPPLMIGANINFLQNLSTDPYPTPQELYERVINGYFVAMTLANLLPSILPNHQLQNNSYAFGFTDWTYPYAKVAIEKVVADGNDEGSVAWMGGANYDVSLGLYDLQAEYNITTVTSGISYSIVFSNPNSYKYYNRLGMLSYNYGVSFYGVVNYYKWKESGLLIQSLQDMIEVAVSYNASCVSNQVDLYGFPTHEFITIPPVANSTWFETEEGKLAMDDILDQESRVLISLTPFNEFVFTLWEYLYDKGYRKGDFVFIVAAQVDLVNNYRDQPEYYNKISEFVTSTINFQTPFFVGDVGIQFIGLSFAFTGMSPTLLGCETYDAMWQLAEGLDHAIKRGNDYEDPKTLHNSMRQTRYTGCSGAVSFESNTNDRSFSGMYIYQTQYNDTTDLFTLERIGDYNPQRAQLFNFDVEVIWPDGSTNPPNDNRKKSFDCPFNEDELQTSNSGQVIIFCIAILLFVCMALVTAFIWRRYWKLGIIPLTERKEYSQSDVIQALIVFIEFFQFIAMGGSATSLHSFLKFCAAAASVDMDEFLEFKEDVYWWVLHVCFIIFVFWVFFFFLIAVFKFHLKYPDSGIAQNVKALSDFALPIICNAAFIPLIVTFINVYACTETIGDDIDDAVLDKDCHVECWTPVHYGYIVACTISLLIYVPTAVYMRPKIQELSYDLNVITLPLYLVCKSVFQIWLIMLSKTLYLVSVMGHAIAYLISCILYTCLIILMRPYNYNRYNLWQVAIFVAIDVVALLNLINVFEGIGEMIAITVMLSCFGAIIVSFIIIQKVKNYKFPALLFFAKMERFEKKVRFMCIIPSGDGDDTVDKIFYRKSTMCKPESNKGYARSRSKYLDGKILPYESYNMEDQFSAVDLESIDNSMRDPSTTLRPGEVLSKS